MLNQEGRKAIVAAFMSVSLLFPAAAQSATSRRLATIEITAAGPVETIELANTAGMRVRILALGAAIQSINVPDRNGKGDDVVLGYATAAEYLAKPQYFGATVGRYANRIAGARFTIAGSTYNLIANNGPNSLHGGLKGFDRQLWDIDAVNSGPTAASVTLSHTSADGEEGYPGALKVTATYTLTEDNALRIDYDATTTKPTVVNITNHAYFALAGEARGRGIQNQSLSVDADHYLPVDTALIPLGERRAVAGTTFDFRTPKPIEPATRRAEDDQIVRGRGLDHSYVLNGIAGSHPRTAARLIDEGSGRVLEVLTTAPALQIYTGNFLDGTISGKGGALYRQGDAICLEAQAFPDAPNQPSFPSTRLDPGQTYHNVIIYRFSVQANTQ